MRDTSEPWALVNCHGNGSDIDIGNDGNGVELREIDCSSSEEGMSVSAHATDRGDASTDATNTTDLNPDDGNIENGKNSAIETITGHILPLPWPDVPSHSGTLLPYDRELNIEDEEGTNTRNLLPSTKIDGTAIIAAHAEHKCATQPDECAAVRAGWGVEYHAGPAIDAWEGIGPRFKQVKRHERATFAIMYDDSQGDDVYAYSFFPMTSRGKLLVCPLSFSDGNSKHLANILTHEIGHILGLRHEFAHVKEAKNPSVLFGSEDPRSVMNYYPNPSDLQVSQYDLEGLRMVYAYDQPMYMGLPIVDISPNLYPFSERSSTNHATKKLTRRLSFRTLLKRLVGMNF
ncbi:hypothetical protein TrVFT333_003664 [Trichoderma virens FT-333]|nr:hypothetical protein TrVFT333_003664 [Trichoderma virens FT-333]